MKFVMQFVIGTVLILPVMIVGFSLHRLASATDWASDWLERKVFADDDWKQIND